MFFLLQIFFIFLLVANLEGQKYLTEKPDYLKTCEIRKPEFDKCSIETVQGLFDNIIKGGIRGLGSTSFEPFVVNKVKINQGDNNAVDVQIDLSNLKLYGLSSTVIKENQINRKDYNWITKLLIPVMKINGNYIANGRILLIPLNGKGKIYLKLENLEITLHMKTKLYRKGDFIFGGVTGVNVDYKIKGLHVNMTNLFNGNKELEESTNRLFNEQWPVIEDALKPVIQQTIEDILFDILKKAFDYIPANLFISDIDTPEELYGGNS